MGAIEALARRRAAASDLNRLFFEYSFLFPRRSTVPEGDSTASLPSYSFSRALPMARAEFEQRLADGYGMKLLHKGYLDFDTLLADLAAFAGAGEPVIAEVDLFHFPGQNLFGTIHEGHVIIATALDREAGRLSFVDAFRGSSALDVAQLRRSFDEITGRQRPYYLIVPVSGAGQHLSRFEAAIGCDLARSGANLDSARPEEGLNAFAAFVSDLEREAVGHHRGFVVEGFWTFMCGAMQNARWLQALACGSKRAQAARDALRERMLWLNKRWFLLNVQLGGQIVAPDPAGLADAVRALRTILDSEAQTRDLIGQLHARQGDLAWPR